MRVNKFNVRMMCVRSCTHILADVTRTCAFMWASVQCAMQVDTSVSVSCGAATTCASTCIGGARRTTLNVPGAAPKFSGANKLP